MASHNPRKLGRNAFGKRPMRIDDEDDDSSSRSKIKEPETERGNKFMKRTGHGQSNHLELTPADFNIRIHKCVAQKDDDQYHIGQPTGNYKVAVSTPIGPKEYRGKWLPVFKEAVDTARLNQRIQYAFASPSWDSLNVCDLHHFILIVRLNRVAKRTHVRI